MNERAETMAKGRYLRGASRRTLLQSFGAAAVGITFTGGLSACGGGSGGRTVNVHNWDTYIGETTLDDFREATGITVNYTNFASNDELFAQFRAGNPGYDIIVPSNEYVTRMAQAQMLQELDKSLIPNAANILPEFQEAPFDPGRIYSMPYTWLCIGIAYRKSKMPANFVPNSWRHLLDSPQFSQRIAVLGESADLIRLAAMYKQYASGRIGELTNIPESMLTQVEQMLIRQKPHIKQFHTDNGQDLLVSGEVDIVMEYNGDIAQVMNDDDDIGWVLPVEGSMQNQDCLCIPANAPHLAEAHAFINYVMDGQPGADIADYIQFATPNAAAKALMPDNYKNNPVVYPPADEVARLRYGAFEGDEVYRQYEEMFTRISAA
jgi:spermidine/putrescine transport system substrate-binding protein